MTDLDNATKALTNQLHTAWNSNASISAYANLRDELLLQHEHASTRIATLNAVVNIAHPSVCEKERAFDPKWEYFFALADAVEIDDREDNNNNSNTILGKRRRTYNQATRMRNLALVASLWSPKVVWHYGWNTAAQGHMKLLRACAIKYPRFKDDFCPRLNSLLLDRHCEAIRFGRRKTLSEAPIQPHRDFDLLALEFASKNNDTARRWVTNDNGAVPVDSGGTLLKDVRPHHYHMYLLQEDENGMLIARTTRTTLSARSTTQPALTPIVDPLSEFNIPNEPQTPIETHLAEYGYGMDLCSDTQELTVSPLALLRQPCVVDTASPSVLTQSSSMYELGVGYCSTPASSNDHSMISPPTEPATEWEVDCGQDSCGTDVCEQNLEKDSSRHLDESDSSENVSRLPRPRKRRQKQRQYLSNQKDPDVQNPISTIAPLRPTQQPNLGALRPARAAQSNSSSSNTPLFVTSPPFEDKDSLALEEKLHNKHYKVLADYVERVAREAATSQHGDYCQVRAQWLLANTKWARVWTTAGSGLDSGTAASEEDAEVLYYPSHDFIMDVQRGKIFQKPVIIKEGFTDSGMHTFEWLNSITRDAWGTAKPGVQRVDDERATLTELENFSAHLRSHARSEHGMNVFTLRNITKAHKPLLTMLTRFRLLDNLVQRLDAKLGQHTGTSAADAESWIGFNLLALEGAFSRTCINALYGKWARNLQGLMFLMVVPEHEMEYEWDTLADDGADWVPNGKQRLVVLEEDDVLFMPPGLRVVYAVHSPTTCIIEGGTLWDERALIPTLQSIGWICAQQDATNEAIAHQLPLIIAELDRLVAGQPERFCGSMTVSEFKAEFDQAIDALRDLGWHHASVTGAGASFWSQDGRPCTCQDSLGMDFLDESARSDWMYDEVNTL